jgi:CDGSH-type Zn-finger protein/uncharacterized Fe-S cluster protein YjdI
MSDDTYTGKAMDRRYAGEDIDITYSVKRCIHAAECVRNLRAVFDNSKRPWIEPNGAPADAVAEVIHLCPSGALHYERKDSGAAEATPEENVILIWEDGPLQFTGDLSISGTGVEVEDETRATLCRCGASQHKPFCDNSHKDAGFKAAGPAAPDAAPAPLAAIGGAFKIAANPDGPLHIQGSLTIRNAAGEIIFRGEETWLCRCGGSANKPFCDGTHKQIGFQG